MTRAGVRSDEAPVTRPDARAVARLDRAVRQAFLLLDALDRRTLSTLSPPLSNAQYHALAALALVPTQTLGELAARLLCDKANASGLIDRLSEAGLATRVRDPRDKRRVALSLTPLGRETLDRATRLRLGTLQRTLAPLGDGGTAATYEALARLVELLQEAVSGEQEQAVSGEQEAADA